MDMENTRQRRKVKAVGGTEGQRLDTMGQDDEGQSRDINALLLYQSICDFHDALDTVSGRRASIGYYPQFLSNAIVRTAVL